MSHQLPPHNRDAERGLLSACLNDADDFNELRDLLSGEDFYFDHHKTCFETICQLKDQGKTVDYVSLAEELHRKKKLEDVGGIPYIQELIGFGHRAYVPRYTQIVLEAKVARSISGICLEASDNALAHEGPVSQLLEKMQMDLDRLSGKLLGDTDQANISQPINTILDQIDQRGRGFKVATTPTGFVELDDLLNSGLRPGHLVILAARPSVGKTSLAVNITRNVCQRGECCLFISLEQSKEELAGRLLASVSGVMGTDIMRGRMNQVDLQKISTASDDIRPWLLDVRDRSGMTASQISAHARLSKRRYRSLNLLVVDYLNETKADEVPGVRTNRNEQLGAICRRLRECARTLQVPCLLLAQLNRDSAKENEVPKLHHLRDSGEIEQIADVVLLLHREEEYVSGQPDRLRLYVAKHRNGPLGSIPFDHDSPRFQFHERLQ